MNGTISNRRFLLTATAYFLALILLSFGDAFFASDVIISAPGKDIDRYFFAVRSFSFDQIRHGIFPLWNPYVCGGIPVLGNFQYALLYPPNWIHLRLPVGAVINITVAFHLILAGLSCSIWCRRWGSSTIASLLGGTLFMFGGPYMSRVYAGHLTYVCVVAWAPLLFLCVDAIIDRSHQIIPALAGGAVVAFQVLAGYPQIVYVEFIGAAVYVLVRLIGHARPWRTVGWLCLMCVSAAGLSAAQLLPGLQATAESIRAESVPYGFAVSYSIPPEDLLTTVAPRIFGDGVQAPSFGRWDITETSLFIGVIGLVLTIFGATTSRGWSELAAIITMLLALLLSFGGYTPVYKLAYQLIPYMDHLRAPARFSFLVSLFASILAAKGFDHLAKTPRLLSIAVSCVVCGLALAAAGSLMLAGSEAGTSGPWARVIHWFLDSHQSAATFSSEDLPSQIARGANLARQQIGMVLIVLALMAIILVMCRHHRRWIFLLAPVALVEMWIGTAHLRQYFYSTTRAPAEWAAALSHVQKDQRVLVDSGIQQNLPMLLGIENINGYDPFVLSRWANLLAPLINSSPLYGEFWVARIKPSPLWSILRLGMTLPGGADPTSHPMPRVSLVSHYSVVADAAASLAAIRQDGFDAKETVILESAPSPAPQALVAGETAGDLRLLNMTCNQLEITADLTHPAILLITDGYSSGWRARALGPGPQLSYQVLPANQALRAVPLAAGRHHLLVEYWPWSVPVGFVTSAVALAAYGVAWGFVLRGRRDARP